MCKRRRTPWAVRCQLAADPALRLLRARFVAYFCGAERGSGLSERVVALHFATSAAAADAQRQLRQGDVIANGLAKRFATDDSELKVKL